MHDHRNKPEKSGEEQRDNNNNKTHISFSHLWTQNNLKIVQVTNTFYNSLVVVRVKTKTLRNWKTEENIQAIGLKARIHEKQVSINFTDWSLRRRCTRKCDFRCILFRFIFAFEYVECWLIFNDTVYDFESECRRLLVQTIFQQLRLAKCNKITEKLRNLARLIFECVKLTLLMLRKIEKKCTLWNASKGNIENILASSIWRFSFVMITFDSNDLSSFANKRISFHWNMTRVHSSLVWHGSIDNRTRKCFK